MTVPANAAAAGTIEIGGDMVVHRMGFGAMRVTGPGILGDPPDLDQARATLRRQAVWGLANLAENLRRFDSLPEPDQITVLARLEAALERLDAAFPSLGL